MNSEEVLKTIKTALDAADVDSVIQPADATTPHPRLILYTGKDIKGRGQMLEMTADAVEMGQELSNDPEEKGRSYLRLQMDSVFPFSVKPSSLAETAQFLHFINLQIDVPGFYLDYFNNIILYRYVMMADADHIPLRMLFSMIGIIMLLQDLFEAPLERLANGEVTFIDLLQEIQKTLAKKI